MIVHTSAIVLKSFPYGDSSLIARCFSKDKGKISLLVKGARSKKSSKASHFEPLSHIDVVYNHKSNRELQILTKVSFINYWSNILNDLRRVTISMAILELTEKTLSYEDPNPALYRVLEEVLTTFNYGIVSSNLLFWFYECALLSNLGFKPNLEDNNLPGLILPNLNEGINSRKILSSLLSERLDSLPSDLITAKDNAIISKYLWSLLCYHFDGLNKVKFIDVTKEILL